MSVVVAGSSPERRRRRRKKMPDGEHASSGDERERVMRGMMDSDDDIKDFAKATMNEFLGWYGYDKIDTSGINLRAKGSSPSSSSSSSPTNRHEDDLSEEDDTGQSLSPHIDSETPANNNIGNTIICDWCKKPGLKLFTLKTSSETKAFCSEPCFSQCRRAAFKKSRVCDWCKHVRHTVNYVDFQDGDHQLQFCSDKCLNQYKMHIFCKETQAYLQMHPQLQEAAKSAGSATSKLITPDLWLRDCQEPVNGNQQQESRSDDEKAPSSAAGKSSISSGELEDLTVTSKSERCSSSNSNPPVAHDREKGQHEQRKNVESLAREKRPVELCNTLDSYLKSIRDRSYSERRKRLHDNDKEHQRKRERMSSPRHKVNQHHEAPPAHLSSQSPISYSANHCRMFPALSTSPFPHSMNNSSSPLNPPAAHSNTLPLHQSSSAPSLPPGLPPPPPLLNNDFLHQSAFNSPYFQQPPFNFLPQQQMDAFLRMQTGLGLRHNAPMFPPHMPHHNLPEFALPMPANPPQHNSHPLASPNTIMLPYPVIVPLPVPIPIPIPLEHLMKVAQKAAAKKDSQASGATNNGEQSKMADSVSSKPVQGERHRNAEQKSSSQSSPCDSSNNDSDKSVRPEKPSYAVTNSDSEAHRIVLTRTKSRPGHDENTLHKRT